MSIPYNVNDIKCELYPNIYATTLNLLCLNNTKPIPAMIIILSRKPIKAIDLYLPVLCISKYSAIIPFDIKLKKANANPSNTISE